ncbi:MAG: dual specificity protein phosphatase family protein [Elainella sp.]
MSFFKKSNPQSDAIRFFQKASHLTDLMSWILPQRLAVGPLPTSHQTQLAHAGIRAVLSLCSEQEGKLPIEITQTLECVRFVLPDSYSSQPLQVGQLVQAVEILQQLMQTHQSVYVHCLAGVERSPLVCISYLCRHQRLEVWEALNLLKQLHPSTNPTPAQLKVVRELRNLPR